MDAGYLIKLQRKKKNEKQSERAIPTSQEIETSSSKHDNYVFQVNKHSQSGLLE